MLDRNLGLSEMPLSPSQRIVLIRGIADALTPVEWTLIDLCLKQFSLPWSDQWEGKKYDYVIHMLADGPDDALIGLAEHVGFHLDEIKPPGISPSFWRKD